MSDPWPAYAERTKSPYGVRGVWVLRYWAKCAKVGGTSEAQSSEFLRMRTFFFVECPRSPFTTHWWVQMCPAVSEEPLPSNRPERSWQSQQPSRESLQEITGTLQKPPRNSIECPTAQGGMSAILHNLPGDNSNPPEAG